MRVSGSEHRGEVGCRSRAGDQVLTGQRGLTEGGVGRIEQIDQDVTVRVGEQIADGDLREIDPVLA